MSASGAHRALGGSTISSILPERVASRECRGDIRDQHVFAEELALVENAVESRRREFATTRWCAHRTLAALGVPDVPLLSDALGAPMWPPGIVGSLTHCTGYRAAAAASSTSWRAIGIDAEVNGPLPVGVLELTAGPSEIEELTVLGRRDRTIDGGRLLFSCKEAVYKAWYSMAGTWLDFEDVQLSFSAAGRTFVARVPAPGGGSDEPAGFCMHGSWIVSGGLILTATVIPRDGDRSRTPIGSAAERSLSTHTPALIHR
jgi:4'-phosphopantetheinyl transferase EntD